MSGYCQIVVKLELGHVAQAKDIPSLSGHTHDWMVFVRGPDGIAIENFIEKVVFWLHESFEIPKVVVKQPPYEVKQSGYAGFNILVDIHFKNKSEPKTVRFHYDMFLHMENMPPVNHTRVEMLTFTNPSEEFKKKLLKAGGVVKNEEIHQIKEKKSHRKNLERKSEEKQKMSSAKEKNYRFDEVENRAKPTEKIHKSESKSVKSKHGDKRRNSVTDFDSADRKKKTKITDLVPSPHFSSIEKKQKEKPNKLKIKIEKSGSPSLFSREESIDIKQLKKKEPSKKEKRSETPVPKKSSKHEEKRKREKKHSLEINQYKQKMEQKPKKRRTMSSGSDQMMTSQSDSDSGKKKKKEKRKKNVFNDTISTGNSSSLKEPKKHRDKKTRVTSSGVKLHIKTLKNPHNKSEKKEQLRNQQGLNQKKKQTVSEKRAPISKVRKVIKDDSSDSLSSDSFDETDKEETKFSQPTKHNNEGTGKLGSRSTLIQPDYDTSDSSSVCSVEDSEKLINVTDNSSSESDGENGNNEFVEVQQNKKLNRPKETYESPQPVPEKIHSLVTVTTGPEKSFNPSLTEEIFQQLQKLQTLLSNITDQNKVKKVTSILQKTGNFSMTGTIMNFDLCSLDKKTIHKIQKQVAAL